jgi:hypothetical protein
MSANAYQPTLNEQREAFSKRRLIATPLAGTIIWFLIGIAALFLPERQMMLVVYIGTGSIIYLALFISKFTGENFLDKTKPKNEFDTLFYITTAMSIFVFAIAIPFALKDHTSVPLSVGILTGLMWLPISWIIRHWVGFFHTITRTVLIVVAWYLFPQHRFVVIPFVIVAVYLVSIVVLEMRWRSVR